MDKIIPSTVEASSDGTTICCFLAFILGLLLLLESLAISLEIESLDVFTHPAFGFARIALVFSIATTYTLSCTMHHGNIVQYLTFPARVKLWAYTFTGLTVAVGFLSGGSAIRFGQARPHDHVVASTPPILPSEQLSPPPSPQTLDQFVERVWQEIEPKIDEKLAVKCTSMAAGTTSNEDLNRALVGLVVALTKTVAPVPEVDEKN